MAIEGADVDARKRESASAAGSAAAMSAFDLTRAGAALSLYEFAIQEADRHKWLVSERHGRDCGLQAWREWWVVHWPLFLRYRWIEHLRGERRWREYGDDAFGRYRDAVVSGDPLVTGILDRVVVGWENLQFWPWTDEWGIPRDRVLQVLEVVNINTAARMDAKA